MKKVCIFLFSGTGMTKYVIDKLKTEFESQQVNVDIYNIEDTQAKNISINDYNILGIANPVHAFNAPKIVIDFVKQLPEVEGISTFIINTAGEYNPINFASSNLLIKILRKKGFDVFYNKQFMMPSNFIIKTKKTEVEKCISNVNCEVSNVAYDIINNVSCELKSGFIAKFATIVGRLEWIGAKSMGKFLYIDKNCNRCGNCINRCPNKNIIMEKNRVKFKWKCGLCMRCIYVCEKQSIKIHHPCKFISIKEWYEEDELSEIK